MKNNKIKESTIRLSQVAAQCHLRHYVKNTNLKIFKSNIIF